MLGNEIGRPILTGFRGDLEKRNAFSIVDAVDAMRYLPAPFKGSSTEDNRGCLGTGKPCERIGAGVKGIYAASSAENN